MFQPAYPIRMLASVRSLAEAKIVLAQGVDIIDLKEPSLGALGAVDHITAKQIVELVDNHVPVSATIGDVPEMEPQIVAERVERMAATNVDIIKVGFFPSPLIDECIDCLYQYTRKGLKIVAVLFADLHVIDPALLARLATKKFYGAMLDTAQKNRGSLVHHISVDKISGFINDCRSHRLMNGLAGSLRKEDVIQLAALNPDYLGFRSALCGVERNGDIDASCVKGIYDLIHTYTSNKTRVPMVSSRNNISIF